jgi:hypothetical protein
VIVVSDVRSAGRLWSLLDLGFIINNVNVIIIMVMPLLKAHGVIGI